ncbi:MAG TPA: hypothetical protein VNU01_04215, partial [Egibacteraceae bacterium]|nr:hypothetical protein [Egibacteraceae bacterium]
MQDMAQGIEYVNDVLFVGLAVVAFRQWRSRRDPQTAWVAVTFVLLSAVVIGGLVLPESGEQPWRVWATKALLVGLLLFPWALYRFTVSFQGSRPRVETVARALTAGVLALTVLLPDVPAPAVSARATVST